MAIFIIHYYIKRLFGFFCCCSVKRCIDVQLHILLSVFVRFIVKHGFVRVLVYKSLQRYVLVTFPGSCIVTLPKLHQSVQFRIQYQGAVSFGMVIYGFIGFVGSLQMCPVLGCSSGTISFFFLFGNQIVTSYIISHISSRASLAIKRRRIIWRILVVGLPEA